jgi:hypothetical protein
LNPATRWSGEVLLASAAGRWPRPASIT